MQRAALLLLVILASAAGMTASAQFDSGAVLGNIKDPSGATVASATVDLISIGQGTRVSRASDSTGGYEFDSVQPGEYTIAVRAPGFEVSTTDAFRVNVGARQRVDLTLKLGSATDTVTVTGAATLLETDSSDRGALFVREYASTPTGKGLLDLASQVEAMIATATRARAAQPPA